METSQEVIYQTFAEFDKIKTWDRVAPRITFREYDDRIAVFVPKSIKPRQIYYNMLLEYDDLSIVDDTPFDIVAKTQHSEEEERYRRTSSLFRAVRTVRELLLCNKFDYFVTVTIDAEKLNRYDLDGIVKEFSYRVKNLNRRRNQPIQYVIVPEQHKDGAWHIHGVMRGILSRDIRENENGYPELIFARKYLGYMTMSKIRSVERCATYVSKYITKSVDVVSLSFGRRLFYASKGLNRATRGVICLTEPFDVTAVRLRHTCSFSNENEHGISVWYDKTTAEYAAFLSEYAPFMVHLK